MLTACLLWASASADPARPALLRTFSAIQSGYSVATGAINNTISGRITVDEAVPGQLQNTPLPDGRNVSVVFNYDTANVSNGGVFSLQPFFEERVCYIYPLPIGRGYKPLVFNDSLIELWCQQVGPVCIRLSN